MKPVRLRTRWGVASLADRATPGGKPFLPGGGVSGQALGPVRPKDVKAAHKISGLTLPSL